MCSFQGGAITILQVPAPLDYIFFSAFRSMLGFYAEASHGSGMMVCLVKLPFWIKSASGRSVSVTSQGWWPALKINISSHAKYCWHRIAFSPCVGPVRLKYLTYWLDCNDICDNVADPLTFSVVPLTGQTSHISSHESIDWTGHYLQIRRAT